MVWGDQWNTRSNQGYKTTDAEYGLVPMPKTLGAKYYANVLGGVHSVSVYAGQSDQDIGISGIFFMRWASGSPTSSGKTHVDLRGDEEAPKMVLDCIWTYTDT